MLDLSRKAALRAGFPTRKSPSCRSTRGTLNASYPRPREEAPLAPLDEDTIREFLATDYGRLVAGVALMCGSRAAAEDAVQEALARAWERSNRGELIRSLKAWVARVAINLVRSGFRRARAERRARERLGRQVGGAASAASATESPEEVADLKRALATLPRRQREATVLRYYLDMDVKEIAQVLGMGEGTAKTTLFRARHTLAGALGEREVEEANDVGRH